MVFYDFEEAIKNTGLLLQSKAKEINGQIEKKLKNINRAEANGKLTPEKVNKINEEREFLKTLLEYQETVEIGLSTLSKATKQCITQYADEINNGGHNRDIIKMQSEKIEKDHEQMKMLIGLCRKLAH